MKKILFTIFACFAFCTSAFAVKYAGCEMSDVSRMKSIVTNINVSYSYYMDGKTPKFSVTLNNITEDIYFEDYFDDKIYYYGDTNNGEITISGYESRDASNFVFYSANPSCYGLDVGKIYYSFPVYNEYYLESVCDPIRGKYICKKWQSVGYDSEELKEKIDEYLTEEVVYEEEPVYEKNWLDNLIDFYLNNYIYLLVGVILVGGIAILVLKNVGKFKL